MLTNSAHFEISMVFLPVVSSGYAWWCDCSVGLNQAQCAIRPSGHYVLVVQVKMVMYCGQCFAISVAGLVLWLG